MARLTDEQLNHQIPIWRKMKSANLNDLLDTIDALRAEQAVQDGSIRDLAITERDHFRLSLADRDATITRWKEEEEIWKSTEAEKDATIALLKRSVESHIKVWKESNATIERLTEENERSLMAANSLDDEIRRLTAELAAAKEQIKNLIEGDRT